MSFLVTRQFGISSKFKQTHLQFLIIHRGCFFEKQKQEHASPTRVLIKLLYIGTLVCQKIDMCLLYYAQLGLTLITAVRFYQNRQPASDL